MIECLPEAHTCIKTRCQFNLGLLEAPAKHFVKKQEQLRARRKIIPGCAG